MNSRKRSVQYAAPGSVLMAGPAVVERMLASRGAAAGVMRWPEAGKPLAAAERIVIRLVALMPLFALSLNGPLKVAPA
jgi:hypothetical protein